VFEWPFKRKRSPFYHLFCVLAPSCGHRSLILSLSLYLIYRAFRFQRASRPLSLISESSSFLMNKSVFTLAKCSQPTIAYMHTSRRRSNPICPQLSLRLVIERQQNTDAERCTQTASSDKIPDQGMLKPSNYDHYPHASGAAISTPYLFPISTIGDAKRRAPEKRRASDQETYA